jgi:hypothetical protein
MRHAGPLVVDRIGVGTSFPLSPSLQGRKTATSDAKLIDAIDTILSKVATGRKKRRLALKIDDALFA